MLEHVMALGNDTFIPHGHCYLWLPSLVGLHVASDSVIALAYLSIPFALFRFVRARRDLRFKWIFVMFGLFILSCGLTHAINVWTVWSPQYWLSGGLKAVTAVISMGTAMMLWRLIPKALALPGPGQLAEANLELQREIASRRQAEESLKTLNAQLETRVAERTAELSAMNERLLVEVEERRAAEQAMRESEERFRAAFEQAAVGMAESGPDGRWLRVNRRACEITGYTEAELLASDFQSITHPDDLERDVERLEELLAGKVPSYSMEKRYVRPDGSAVWVNLTAAVVRVPGRAPTYMAVIEDIDTRKQVEEQLRIAAKALDSAAEGVVIARRGTIISVNRAFSAITGYSAEDALGQPVHILYAIDQESVQARTRRQGVGVEGYWQGEICGRRMNGEIYPAWSSTSRIFDDSGQPLYVTVFSDISASKQYEARLEHLAHHDVLTGLPNRALFQERLREMLARAERHGHLVAVLFVDLDRFKPINDTLGHEAGDRLLRLVAERLRTCLRATDTVARLGGDEFAVLLDELRHSDEAGLIARSLLDALARPFVLLGQDQYISASIGLSCFPADGRDPDTLLRHADIAMYQSKNEGRNAFRFFAAEMNALAAEKLYLTNSLRVAVDRGELRLVYQPRVGMTTGAVVGVEALVRWEHPEHGTILPARFISLAEETGLISTIGEWVLRQAAADAQRWRAQGLHFGRVAVNLSPRQFLSADLAHRLLRLLEANGLQPDVLELEVTEGVVMQNPDQAARVLLELNEAGVSVSIDDFGTGYSSLSYLKRFRVQALKIDRSFVAGLPDDASDAALTRAIVGMAAGLGLGVTAEGIETESQVEALRAIGCESGQGHYFSPPVPAQALQEVLKAGVVRVTGGG